MDDKGFLFLNGAKKAFLLSGASWRSSCYFSPGFSFLLTSQLYEVFELWSQEGREGEWWKQLVPSSSHLNYPSECWGIGGGGGTGCVGSLCRQLSVARGFPSPVSPVGCVG